MRKQRRARVEVWMKTKDAGQPLARARKRARLTQRELAFLARCSQTTVYLLETGRMLTCSDDLALRLIDRLPIDLEDAFEPRAASRTSLVASGTGTGTDLPAVHEQVPA
jgi:putative transcriptional regulator